MNGWERILVVLASLNMSLDGFIDMQTRAGPLAALSLLGCIAWVGVAVHFMVRPNAHRS